MERKFAGTLVTLKQGDLSGEAVDAVVNAANGSLMGGAGVDGAIHRRGGPAILQACKKLRQKLHGQLGTSEAAITTAGRLPARFVIHTVGPIFAKDPCPAETLAKTYHNCLALAREHGLKSLAFPSISTGAYGYPMKEAAPIALQSVKDFLDGPRGLPRELRFVLFTEEALEIYSRALEAL